MYRGVTPSLEIDFHLGIGFSEYRMAGGNLNGALRREQVLNNGDHAEELERENPTARILSLRNVCQFVLKATSATTGKQSDTGRVEGQVLGLSDSSSRQEKEFLDVTVVSKQRCGNEVRRRLGAAGPPN